MTTKIETKDDLAAWAKASSLVGVVASVTDRGVASFGEALAKEGLEWKVLDASTDEGGDVALDLGVTDLPAAVVLGGSKPQMAASAADVPAAVAKARGTSSKDEVDPRKGVREAYAATATGGERVIPGDCGDFEKRRGLLGYDGFEVDAAADLGLGCGNPLIAAKLQPGEVVVDLGSGAGIDCFAAAKLVGARGRIIGVDMTPEMIDKARATAKDIAMDNVVAFRLGEIEHLPVGDGVADVLISNCVINLSPDKPQVYREMNRVLAPGGRISISDVLRTAEIPPELQTAHAYACWVAGASAESEMRDLLADAGFVDVTITRKSDAEEIISAWMPGSKAEDVVTSAAVTAIKPKADHGARDDVFRTATPHSSPVPPAPAFAQVEEAAKPACWG